MSISTQIRGGYMTKFVSHETLKYPGTLSKFGLVRSGNNKSELVKYIKNISNTVSMNESSAVSVAVAQKQPFADLLQNKSS